MSNARILVVDDDESLRRVTQVQLEGEGYAVSTAVDGPAALAELKKSPRDLVISDMKMPGMSGVELLRRVRGLYPEIVFILTTAYGTVESAVEAMKLGAYDYITKPVNPDALRITVRRAVEHVRLREAVVSLRHGLDKKSGIESIIGRSAPN